jgi:glutathione S-transferase
MLTVYHLGVSQSERIPWLCEELGVPYELKRYNRDNGLAHPIFRSLHPLGSAPVITDDDLTLAESGAIMEYIIHRYGNGRLSVQPDASNYADYLYWYHFANATLMVRILPGLMMSMAGLTQDSPMSGFMKAREDAAFDLIENRLKEEPYLAGPDFTAADIINFFPLTTMRAFTKRDFSQAPNTRAYLARVGQRPAYLRAMAACEPAMALTLS